MSSKDVLSEGELDALMETFADEGAPAGDPAFQKNCAPFDFSTREQNLLAQMPALKNLNEKTALALAPAIRKLYGFSVQVDVEETRLLQVEELFVEFAAPTAVNMVRLDPLNGIAYVVLPGELLSVFVDNYFGGGSGGGAPAARTHLTHSERRINDALVESFLTTLTETWSEKVQLTATLEAFESNPEFLQPPTPAEQALCFSFGVRMNDWTSRILWVVPYSAMEPLRPKLASASVMPTSRNTDWEQHFLQELLHVELEVSGAFLSERASIADVLSFKTGTIVPLKMPSEVLVSVEGHTISTGEHGVLNGHKSIKIKEMLHGDV